MHIDWQGDSALCAWIDGQQVAMLDISKCADGVTVNMLFVKPPFRRRGIVNMLFVKPPFRRRGIARME